MTWTRVRSALRPRLGWLWILPFIVAIAIVWPARFGGSAVFVVVRGESMEPLYHSGDLIYARSADRFDMGDVAVYRQSVASEGESLVIHRVVGEYDNGTYLLMGDNRDFPDNTRPTVDDLVGLPITNLGPFPTMLLVRLPLMLAIAVGLTVAWGLWPRADELVDETQSE